MRGATARRLARLARSVLWSGLPRDVKTKARLCLLDWLGCAVAGASAQRVPFLLDGGAEASVIGYRRRAAALSAALVNGVSAHRLEMDDVHEPSIYHPGAPVISAALAAAQRERAGGRRFLEAVVAGYEVSIRLGEAAQPDHYRFWHTTGTVGTFGAAVAAGRLLGLDEAGMEAALHLAATQAAGLWAAIPEGRFSKPLHAGKAAQSGLLAALLASEGLDGSPTLDGPRGYFAATSGGLRGLDLRPGRWKIREVAFKPYASCRFTHGAIDAALALREEADASEVRSIDVRMARSPLALVGKSPRTPEEARFSLPYCVAAAWVKGRVSVGEFEPRSLRDREVRALTRKVRMRADPALERLYPRRWPVVVRVRTARGTLSRRVEFALGDPRNPMDEKRLVQKFVELTGKKEWAERALRVDRVGDLSRVRWWE